MSYNEDNGFYIYSSNNLLVNNTISFNNRSGIEIQKEKNTLINNNISSNLQNGVAIKEYNMERSIRDFFLFNNIISWNKGVGISLYQTINVSIFNNTINFNSGGIYSSKSYISIMNNNISSNSWISRVSFLIW